MNSFQIILHRSGSENTNTAHFHLCHLSTAYEANHFSAVFEICVFILKKKKKKRKKHRNCDGLHPVLICNGQGGLTLPAAMADSLSELISKWRGH